MKKIMSFILACVLCVALIPASAFADTDSTDDLFGVILDAEGNVVEYLQKARIDTYVNEVYVIPAGGSIITYQYTTTQNFLFGYATTAKRNSLNEPITYITELYRTFELSIELSNTLGGGGRVTMNGAPKISGSVDPEFCYFGDQLMHHPTDDDYMYCNGKIVNTSQSSATIRLIAARNFNEDEKWVLW